MTPAQKAAFARLSPLMARSGPVFAEQLRGALDSGQAQVWPSDEATVLTLVTDHPPEARRVLHVLKDGDGAKAEALMPGVRAWANVVGCTDEREWVPPVPEPTVILLSPTRAARLWPDVEAWVAAALETTFSPITLEDVRQATAAGGMQLWAVMEGGVPVAVAVTMLRERADGLRLSLGPIAGEGAERWAVALDVALTTFARLHGCRGIISEGGRRGWGRIARSLGWREGSTVYGKDLVEEAR